MREQSEQLEFEGLDTQAYSVPGVYTYATLPQTVEPSSIVFQGKDEDIMVLRPNGDILVHGKLVENDKEVVEGLRKFLRLWGQSAGIYTGEIGRLAGASVVATSFLDAEPGQTYARALVINNSAFVS